MASISRMFRPVVIAALLLAALPVLTPATAAYGAPGAAYILGEKPLVLIRFNQRTVMYERPLYIAVSRALQTKPTARFDIVSVVPQNSLYVNRAPANLNRVVATLVEMGVPQNRLNIRRQLNAPVETDEVHIFAR